MQIPYCLFLFSFFLVSSLYSAHCQQNERLHVMAYGEYLYWLAEQESLHFAIDGIQEEGMGQLYAIEGTWDSGFRVGAGIVLPCQCQELTFDWTRFRTGDSEFVLEDGLDLFPTRGNPGGPGNIIDASAEWQLEIDSLRLRWAIPLSVHSCLLLQPYLAVRSDLIHQHFHVHYEVGGANDNCININSRFWGVGPEIGFESRWFLYKRCFSLFADASYSLLRGCQDLQELHDRITSSNNDVHVEYSILKLQSVVSLQLGLRWQGCINIRCQLPISVQAGWESNIWFDQSGMLAFTDRARDGSVVFPNSSLKTSGLTLRASIAY